MKFLKKKYSFPIHKLVYHFIKLKYGFFIGTSGNYKYTYIFGKKVYFNFLDGFFNIFCEIFIQESYNVKLKKKSPIIFDIGGNIGLTSIYFKLIYPKAKIIVFEGNPLTYNTLCRNVSDIKDISTNNVLLGEKIEKVNFFYTTKDALGASIYKSRSGAQSKKIELTTTKLSSFINKQIDLLKMDVEGSELNILKDIYKTKKIKFIKNIIMEYHYISNSSNNNLSEVIKILEISKFMLHFEINDVYNHSNKKNNYTISIHATKK